MDFGFALPLGEFRYAGGRLGAFGDTVVGDDRDGGENGDDYDDDQELDDGETLGFGAATVHFARTPQKIISY